MRKHLRLIAFRSPPALAPQLYHFVQLGLLLGAVLIHGGQLSLSVTLRKAASALARAGPGLSVVKD
jgi:hypothetical protein